MLEPFCAAVCETLNGLADSLEVGAQPPPLPTTIVELSSSAFTPLVRARLERLARQTGTLHDAVLRLTAPDDVAASIPVTS